MFWSLLTIREWTALSMGIDKLVAFRLRRASECDVADVVAFTPTTTTCCPVVAARPVAVQLLGLHDDAALHFSVGVRLS